MVGSFSPNFPALRPDVGLPPNRLPRGLPLSLHTAVGLLVLKNTVDLHSHSAGGLGGDCSLCLRGITVHAPPTLKALSREWPATLQRSSLNPHHLSVPKRSPTLFTPPPTPRSFLPPTETPSRLSPPASSSCPPAAKVPRGALLPKSAGLIIQTIHPQVITHGLRLSSV